jgi:hypothetical protein
MTDSKRESERQEQRNIHSESQSQPPSVNSAGGRDLVDTFELFKNFLDHKLVNLKSDLISEQDSRSKKYREDSNIKVKSEGNRIQHRCSEEVLECLQKLYKQLLDTERPSATIGSMSQVISPTTRRTRRELGRQYPGHFAQSRKRQELALCCTLGHLLQLDQRPLLILLLLIFINATSRPFVRASQGVSRRAWDLCHLCKQFGHWRKDCPLNVKYQPVNTQPNATNKP